MLKFLQQMEAGYGDYTNERYQLKEPTLEEFKAFVREKKRELMINKPQISCAGKLFP
jgi:hypothetical protein